MTEGRRVTRREPITTTVVLGGGKEVEFIAHPLPWRKRNDFGEALNSMYSAALNEELKIDTNAEGVAVGLVGGFFDAHMDYPGLFTLGYSTYDDELNAIEPAAALTKTFDQLDFDPMIEVLGAVLEVNGLERIAHLLDPERKVLRLTGASESANEETTSAGEKMESPSDSG